MFVPLIMFLFLTKEQFVSHLCFKLDLVMKFNNLKWKHWSGFIVHRVNRKSCTGLQNNMPWYRVVLSHGNHGNRKLSMIGAFVKIHCTKFSIFYILICLWLYRSDYKPTLNICCASGSYTSQDWLCIFMMLWDLHFHSFVSNVSIHCNWEYADKFWKCELCVGVSFFYFIP